MIATLQVTLDLLREARARKWVWALALLITAALTTVALALRLEVVDGMLAASSFFGDKLGHSYISTDRFLKPLFQAAAYMVFYGGLSFGILASADFAPSLLAPGRIEHMLALPLRRTELLLGTYLGVLLLVGAGMFYGAGGISVILGVKAGLWSPQLLIACLLSLVAFSSVYAAMLAVAVFVRSAAISAGMGALLLTAGIVATYRIELMRLFEPGLGRELFVLVSAPIPRLAALANLSGSIAASAAVDATLLVRLVGGALLFGLTCFSIAAFRFSGKDY